MKLTKQLCICLGLGLLLIISDSANGAGWIRKATGMSCKKMDVTLLLDSSSNVGKENFQDVLRFARRLVEKLIIGPDNVKLAVIYYGGKAQIQFDLNRYSTAASVMEALPDIPYVGGIPNLSGAITKMRTEIFTSTSGDRQGVPKLGLIVSGGKSEDKQSAINEATLARNSGILLYYVGKLPEVDMEEIFEESLGIISKEQYGYFFGKWKSITKEATADSINRTLCLSMPHEEILMNSVNRNSNSEMLP